MRRTKSSCDQPWLAVPGHDQALEDLLWLDCVSPILLCATIWLVATHFSHPEPFGFWQNLKINGYLLGWGAKPPVPGTFPWMAL